MTKFFLVTLSLSALLIGSQTNSVFAEAKLAKIIGGEASLNTDRSRTNLAKIISGKEVTNNQWSWIAGLVHAHTPAADGLYCSASLIAKKWILTAAHCVIDENSQSIEVIINQVSLDKNDGERLAVEQIIMHPQYNDNTLHNDLALIKLTQASKFEAITVLPPFSSQDNKDQVAIALGWGSINRSQEAPLYPLDLQQVDLPIISNSRCAQSMGDITNNVLCAGDGLGHKDTCFGDSGGPLIVFDKESQSWRQAGITSWGTGCAIINQYGVYTRLKNYARFISDNICSPEQQLETATLELTVNDKIIYADWEAVNNASGYRLAYAPYPKAENIYSLDINKITQFSTPLVAGSAFYVAISSYNGNCLSEYSNIEHFRIH